MSTTMWNRRRAMHDHDVPVNSRSVRPPLPPGKAAKLRDACAEALKDSRHRPRQSRETNAVLESYHAGNNVKEKRVAYEAYGPLQMPSYPVRKVLTPEPPPAKPWAPASMIPQPVRSTSMPIPIEKIHPALRNEYLEQTRKQTAATKLAERPPTPTSPPRVSRSTIPRRPGARASSPLLGQLTSGLRSSSPLNVVAEPSSEARYETPGPRVSSLQYINQAPPQSEYTSPHYRIDSCIASSDYRSSKLQFSQSSQQYSTIEPETPQQNLSSPPSGEYRKHAPPPLFSSTQSKLPVAKPSANSGQKTPDRYFRPSQRSLRLASSSKAASRSLLPAVNRVEDSLTHIEDKKAELIRLEWQLREVTARLQRLELVSHRRRHKKINSAGVVGILKPSRNTQDGDGTGQIESERDVDAILATAAAVLATSSRTRKQQKLAPLSHRYKSSLSSSRSPGKRRRRPSNATPHRHQQSVSSFGADAPSSIATNVATDAEESSRVSLQDFPTPLRPIPRTVNRHRRQSSEVMNNATRVSEVPSLFETAIATSVPYTSARSAVGGVAVIQINNPNHATIRAVPQSTPSEYQDTEGDWVDEDSQDVSTLRTEEADASSLRTEDLEQDFGNLRGWQTRSEWTPSDSSRGIHYRLPSRSSPFPLKHSAESSSPCRNYSRRHRYSAVYHSSPPTMTLYPDISPLTPAQALKQLSSPSDISSDPFNWTPEVASRTMWRVHNPDQPSVRDSHKVLPTLEEFPDAGQQGGKLMAEQASSPAVPTSPEPTVPKKFSDYWQPVRLSKQTYEQEMQSSGATHALNPCPLPKGRFRTWLRKITPTGGKLKPGQAKDVTESKALTPKKPRSSHRHLVRSDSVLHFEQTILKELGLPAGGAKSKSRRASIASAKMIAQEMARSTYTEGMPFTSGVARLSRGNMMASPVKAGPSPRKVYRPVHSRHSTRSTFRYSFGSAPSLNFPNYPASSVPPPQIKTRPRTKGVPAAAAGAQRRVPGPSAPVAKAAPAAAPVNYCRKPGKHTYNPSMNSDSTHGRDYSEAMIQPF